MKPGALISNTSSLEARVESLLGYPTSLPIIFWAEFVFEKAILVAPLTFAGVAWVCAPKKLKLFSTPLTWSMKTLLVQVLQLHAQLHLSKPQADLT